jgi:hypothetical protein
MSRLNPVDSVTGGGLYESLQQFIETSFDSVWTLELLIFAVRAFSHLRRGWEVAMGGRLSLRWRGRRVLKSPVTERERSGGVERSQAPANFP